MPYYVFEGPDGSGKTTVLKGAGEELIRAGYKVHFTRSPGQTQLGQCLRKMVLDDDLNVDFLSRQILFMADTVNYYETYLKPLLEDDRNIILQDRSSYISSVVYGMADGLPLDPLARMLSIYNPLKAAKLFIMSTPAEVCHARRIRGVSQNIYDVQPLGFYKKCCETYSQFITDSELRLILTEFVHLDNVLYMDNTEYPQQTVDRVVQTIKADMSTRQAA